LFAETLEPLARFVWKQQNDLIFAEEDFLGLENQEYLGQLSTNESICAA
jgi:hypothetical protein